MGGIVRTIDMTNSMYGLRVGIGLYILLYIVYIATQYQNSAAIWD